MEFYYILLILLGIWLFILTIDEKKLKKRNIERSLIILIWRTERGINLIDYIANKGRKIWVIISNISVVVSVPIMLLVFVSLIFSAKDILVTPGAPAGVTPVIPGVKIPGSPIFLPLWYGIPALIIVLVAHEFSHGIIARLEKLELKSVGLFFVTLLPLGAFVEPDEEELNRRSRMTKLRIYAAGSFGNFLVALATFLLLTFLITPALFIPQNYMMIEEVMPDTPASKYGLEDGSKIVSINGVKVNTREEFVEAVKDLKPDQKIVIETDRGKVSIIATATPIDEDKGYVGISTRQYTHVLKPGVESVVGERIPTVLTELLSWIFLLNLFIGLTNLLPIIPLDGGRMFEELVGIVSPRVAKPAVNLVLLISLALILINMSPLLKAIL